jgi:hypothetical protein
MTVFVWLNTLKGRAVVVFENENEKSKSVVEFQISHSLIDFNVTIFANHLNSY